MECGDREEGAIIMGIHIRCICNLGITLARSTGVEKTIDGENKSEETRKKRGARKRGEREERGEEGRRKGKEGTSIMRK